MPLPKIFDITSCPFSPVLWSVGTRLRDDGGPFRNAELSRWWGPGGQGVYHRGRFLNFLGDKKRDKILQVQVVLQ